LRALTALSIGVFIVDKRVFVGVVGERNLF
jgi:hypothetical protein